MNPQEENSVDYIKKSFELKNSKLYKEAIEMLYKALELEEGRANTEIISQIGDLYVLLKNYERAIEEYEKVLDIDKKHIHSLEEMSKIYFLTGNYSKALEASKKLLESTSEAKYYINHFQILYKLKYFDKMRELYESISENLKNHPHILYLMSKTGLYPKTEFLKRATEGDSNLACAYFELAIEYFNEEKFNEAKPLFKHVIELEKNSNAYFYLGMIEHIEGNFFDAIDNYLECIKLDKTNDKCCFELAKAYIDINWLEEAQIAIKGSIGILKLKDENSPKLDEHHFLLAWILSKQDDIKGALLYLDLIDKDSKMYPNAQILKNTLNLTSDNHIKAKEVLENYYNNNPDDSKNPILIESLGKIYKNLKLYKEAINLYEKALEFFPNSLFYALELVDILIDDKQYDKALEIAKKLEHQAPKCPSTYNSFARIYYRLKNYDAAIENLKILNQLDINNAEGFYFLGLVQNDTCQAQAALENFKIALTLNPMPAKYYAQAARAYETLGDYENAMLYIKEAIEIAPEEINYKRQAKDIAQKMNDKEKVDFYSSQIARLEQLLRQRG